MVWQSFVLDDDPDSTLGRALRSVVVDDSTSLREAACCSESFRFWEPGTDFPHRNVRHVDFEAGDGSWTGYENTMDLPDGSRITESELRRLPVNTPGE